MDFFYHACRVNPSGGVFYGAVENPDISYGRRSPRTFDNVSVWYMYPEGYLNNFSVNGSYGRNLII